MSHNDIYETGYFSDATLNIYNSDGSIGKTLINTSSSGGSYDVFTVKYNSSGNVEWAAQMGSISNGSQGASEGLGISTDSKNNVYITGLFNDASFNIYNADGTIGKTLFNKDSNRNYDVFTVKYNSSGTLLWATQMGTLKFAVGVGVSTDSKNNVYVTGIFTDEYFNIYNADGTIGKILLNTGSNGNYDIFTVKYNSSGNVVWGAQMGGINTDSQGLSNSTDNNNNIYITGLFSDISFNIYNADGTIGKTLINTTTNYHNNVFTVKYKSSGNVAWAAQMGGTNNSVGLGISTDNNNNVYVTGHFYDVSFNIYNADGTIGKTLINTSSTGTYDVFTVKYNSTGNVEWAALMGGINNSEGLGISTDNNNNVYVTGFFNDATLNIYNSNGTIGKTLIKTSSTGTYDVFTVKYNSSGNVVWTAQMGGINSNNPKGLGISTDNNNNVYIIGSFNDTTLNIYNSNGTYGKILTNTNSSDYYNVFTVKYSSSGTVLWGAQMGSLNNDSRGYGISSSKYIKQNQNQNDIPISNICFLSDTTILLDQGLIPIINIKPKIHTIRCKPIVAITKTVSQDDYLVVFEKDSLGPDYPNKKTVMSKHHKIFYYDKIIEANKFLGHFINVKKKKYNGEIMCNILMEKYEKINANNIICETLHPNNSIAKLYNTNLGKEYRIKIVQIMNDSIMKKDEISYKKIMNHLHT